MLTHPLFEQLQQLRCSGMIAALKEQMEKPDIAQLSFDERLALLIERECLLRENRRLKNRLRQAKLKTQACLEDIDYQAERGLIKSIISQLSSCDWIGRKQNLLITGATGTGKTFLSCAFAHQGCLQGYTSYYIRLPRLFQMLTVAKGDGTYMKFLITLAKTQLLILDDWGLTPMDDNQRRDLLEILDDRHNHSSTIVTSQLPIKLWHDAMGDPTLNDAILDRLVHNAHKLELKGESMRKKQANNLIPENSK